MSSWAYREYINREFHLTWSSHMARLKHLRSEETPATGRKLPWFGYHVYF